MDSLSDLGLLNLPRAAGRTLLSMAEMGLLNKEPAVFCIFEDI